ncbi:SDR family oxidoreductase [Mangrovicella endophytica]|uniref:SDR family oxidoreductase n=1 Tax=Mangrovicella endophytica TaxID=2066697 RepID=UPI000C9E093B|nr:SDR family oxidoreductase [Mangrovicella endophytica]
MTYLDRLRPRKGLRVLVTAGASGIGAAIAAAFLEAGAKLAICDVDAAALERFKAEHPDAQCLVADVSDPEAVDRLFDGVEHAFGGLDVLVNNAGIAGPTGPIETLSTDDIRRTIEIDLVGQLLVTRRAAALLKRSDDAAIINISSVAGRFGYAMRSPYSASKWGIVGLTATLAKEMGPDGVRVNAILPGVVRGARMDKVISARAEASGRTVAAVEEDYLSSISLRRMVDPDDVALTALFLSSPAGANISGQSIGVCGNVEYL